MAVVGLADDHVLVVDGRDHLVAHDLPDDRVPGAVVQLGLAGVDLGALRGGADAGHLLDVEAVGVDLHRGDVADWADEKLVNAVRAELRLSMNVLAEPVFQHITRWPAARPSWLGTAKCRSPTCMPVKPSPMVKP